MGASQLCLLAVAYAPSALAIPAIVVLCALAVFDVVRLGRQFSSTLRIATVLSVAAALLLAVGLLLTMTIGFRPASFAVYCASFAAMLPGAALRDRDRRARRGA